MVPTLRQLRATAPARLREYVPVPTTLAGRVVLVTYLASLAVMIGFVARHATRVPFLDEYANFHFLFDTPGLAAYWAPHNEHRIPLPRVVYVAVVKMSGYDFRAPLVLNAGLLAAVTAFLLAAVRRARGRLAISDAVIPLLVLGIAQWENLIWGFQVQFVLSTTLVLTFCGLAVWPGFTRSKSRLAAAGAAAVLLPLCGSNGVPFGMTFGAALLLIGAVALRAGERVGWIAVAGGVLAVGVVPVYFHGLNRATAIAAPSPTAFCIGFVNLLGFGFGPASYLPHGESYRGLTAVGVVTALFLVWTGVSLLLAVVRNPAGRDRALALGAALAGVVGLAAGVAYGRAANPGGIFAPRYVTLFLPGLVAAYLTWVTFPRGRVGVCLPPVLLAAAVVAVVPNARFVLGVAGFHSDRLKRVEHEARSGLPVVFVADRNPWLFPGQPEARRVWLDLLRRHGIAPFRAMAADPTFTAEPVPVSVARVEGMEQVAGDYRVTTDHGGLVLSLPRRGHVHAVRLVYTASRPGGGLPRSVVSWDRGGRVPPAPGYGVIDTIDAHPGPAESILLIDKEIDTLRIDLFGQGTTVRVHALALLRTGD